MAAMFDYCGASVNISILSKELKVKVKDVLGLPCPCASDLLFIEGS